MRIAYCTNVRLPSERAHGHQIAQVCDALTHLGHEVHLFAPYRRNVVLQSYHDYYHAEPTVKLTHLGTFDPIDSWIPQVLQLPVLNRSVSTRLADHLKPGSYDLAYTRAPALLPVLLNSGLPVILELHQLPRWNRSAFVRQCNRCTMVACLTSSMRDTLMSWGMHKDRVMAEGDAVDLRRFTNLPSKEEAREEFGLTTERKVVGYVGRLKTLGMEKGVKVLLEALAQNKTWFGFIVGGPDGDKQEYEKMASALGLTAEDVRFTGSIEARFVPSALAACDVLAMPFPDLPHYRHHMSPLKMFEYMAANRVIITTDLPTVRDVLSEDEAVFCAPDSAEDLARALTWISEHASEATTKSQKASQLVLMHSWEHRMQRVLNAAKLPSS